MKKILVSCIYILAFVILGGVAYGDGANLYFTDTAANDHLGAPIAAANLHPYASHATRIEFFANSLPASNTGTRILDGVGGYSIKYYYVNIGGTNYNKYQINFPAGAGGTLYVRIWDTTAQTLNNYYAIGAYGVSAGTTLPTDNYITSITCDHLANVPDTAVITQFNESFTYLAGQTTSEASLVTSARAGTAASNSIKPFTNPNWYKWNNDGSARPGTPTSQVVAPAYSYPPGTQTLTLQSPDVITGGNYKFQVNYQNEWGVGTDSSVVTHALAGGGGGGAVAALYAFKKVTSSFGINQFSVPMSGTVTFDATSPVPTHTTGISTLADLVSAIKAAAGSTTIVKTVGWWDKNNQIMVGWTDVDTTPVAQNGAPSTLAGETIQRDKVYQMSVSTDISFTLSGNR